MVSKAAGNRYTRSAGESKGLLQLSEPDEMTVNISSSSLSSLKNSTCIFCQVIVAMNFTGAQTRSRSVIQPKPSKPRRLAAFLCSLISLCVARQSLNTIPAQFFLLCHKKRVIEVCMPAVILRNSAYGITFKNPKGLRGWNRKRGVSTKVLLPSLVLAYARAVNQHTS